MCNTSMQIGIRILCKKDEHGIIIFGVCEQLVNSQDNNSSGLEDASRR